MRVTPSHEKPATNGARRRLDVQLFDELTAARGATTVVAQAKFVGVAERTLHRLRQGDSPRLDKADLIATRLGRSITTLFPRQKTNGNAEGSR